MPQYFFEVSDGTETLEDGKGCIFSNVASARDEAIRIVESFYKFHAAFFVPNWAEWVVCVKQDKKGVVLQIPFTEVFSINEGVFLVGQGSLTSAVWSCSQYSRPSWSSIELGHLSKRAKQNQSSRVAKAAISHAKPTR